MAVPRAILILLLTIPESAPLRNNVLFVVVDDLRPALGTYGDPNAYTPNINKLAKESFVFANAFAQQALCAPSRNSFLTSRRPDSLHLYDFYSYWRDVAGNFTTLPQHFKEHGYYTQSIGKVFHPGISSNFNDDSPYSWSGVPFHPKTLAYKEAKVCLNPDGTLSRNLVCPILVENQPGGTLPDLETLNAATEFLKNHKNTPQPYFLAVGFHKPHVPIKFPREYLKYHPLEDVILPTNRWKNPLLPAVAWNPFLDVKNRDDIRKLNISFPFGTMPDDMTRQIIRGYNAATTYIDDLLGILLKEVDFSNTIIVFTGDHGWSLGEHGEFSKFSNYDIATRVPLIIHVPKLSQTQIIIQQLVELVDLFPTLVDLTQISNSLPTCTNGKKTKLCTEGRSLVPIMAKTKLGKVFESIEGGSTAFSQYPRPGVYPTIKPNSDRPRLAEIQIMGYSIRTERYRYTEWIKFNHTNYERDWNTVYGRELYDHLIDPRENLNLEARNELKWVIKNLHNQLIQGFQKWRA